MKHVRRRGAGASPVWVGQRDGGAIAYYRALIPARITRGSHPDALPLSPHDRAGCLAGNPVIFRINAVGGDVVGAIMDLAAAGGNVWLELDDDPIDMPTGLGVTAEEWGGVVRTFAHVARAVRGLVVSTQALAGVVGPYNPRVRVLPNVVDPSDFARVSRPGDGVLRVGYAAARLHHADLQLALPGLLAVGRLPNTEVHFFGTHPYSPVLSPEENAREGRYTLDGVPYCHHPPRGDFMAYHRAIGILDVAVAPLVDHSYNRCRSHCKWLEHSLHQTAMVVSDLPPYACATDGVDCLKARSPEEFTTQFLRLVEDADLRRSIGAAARAEVLRNHTPASQAPAIRAMFAELRKDSAS